MQSIENADITGKTVILRCDFNVPIIGNEITDYTRINKSLKTINYLISKKCKIVILSHLGRVNTLEDCEKNSLQIVASKLNDLIDPKVVFLSKCCGDSVKSAIESLPIESVIVLENTRHMDLDGSKEKNCDDELSKSFASLGDIFINDAFGLSHRKHASNYGISKYLPTYAGFLMLEEVSHLNCLLENPERPFTVFMGGAKVEDKLPIIESLLTKCDYLLLGGGILNSFLRAMDIDVLDSLATDDPEVLLELKMLINTYSNKIKYTKSVKIIDNKIMDVNMTDYKEYINSSKLIFLNGAPGVFENDACQVGTRDLLYTLTASNARVIVGGGDSVSAVNKFSDSKDYYFVSSGGGASLEYISSGKLMAFDV